MKLENYGVRQGGLSRRGYLGRYRVGGLQLFGDYFWHEAQKLAVKTGMGCSLLFMHPQITEAELACLFWRS
jgi:hypothetical protein